MHKNVDPGSPVHIRMMAAKAVIPLAPCEMLGALFMLSFDSDASVRETAAKTAGGLPDRILAPALRDESGKAPLLAPFLNLFGDNEAYAQMVILNATTPDEAVAKVASKCGSKIAEIVAQNQLRVLRHEDIIRQLCRNPNASKSMTEGVCEFAVRSGGVLDGGQQIQDARLRVFGPDALNKRVARRRTSAAITSEYLELSDDT